MLNSEDKVVQSLKTHFNMLGVEMQLNDKKIIIKDALLRFPVVTHAIVSVLLLGYIHTLTGTVYTGSMLILYALIAYLIGWVDYRSVNTIEFDFVNKHVSIRNRSILRRLAYQYAQPPRPSRYYFEEISGIEQGVKTRSFFQSAHFVRMRFKNGSGIGLIRFSDEINAILFSKFLTTILS